MKKIIIACSLVLLMASGCSLTQKDESKKLKRLIQSLSTLARKSEIEKRNLLLMRMKKKIPLFKIKKKQTPHKLVKCWGIHLDQIRQRLTKK